nr:putative Ig domain-containing protein [Crocosphaera sp.]
QNAETRLAETIGYLAIASGSGNGVTLQVGRTGDSVTHELFTINFAGEFDNIPHFLANIATYDGPDPSTLRFQNLTSNSVEVTVQEDITFDEETTHATEVVNYLAVDGNSLLQGFVYDSATGNPIIMGTDSGEYLLGLAGNDTRTGLAGNDIFVLESDQGTDIITDFELGVDTIGLTGDLTYSSLTLTGMGDDTVISFNSQSLAILQGVTITALDSNDFLAVTLDNQPPTVINAIADQILLSNQSFNLAVDTAFEDAGDTLTYNVALSDGSPLPSWLTFDGTQLMGTPTVDDISNLSVTVTATDSIGNSVTDEFNLGVFNSVTADTFTLGEANTITLDHNRQTITLDRTYNNPVIFAPSVSYNGYQLATPRIANITNNSFEIYLQEPSNEDGTHISETLSYFVFEAGTYQLTDGTILEVGTLNTDATANLANGTLTPWQTVDFDIDFADTPVIFSQVQTDNDSDLVRTRQQNATATGFEVVMEEDEIKGQNAETRLAETIGYVAISGGYSSNNGVTLEVGSTGNSVTDQLFNINFEGQFNNIPHLLANIATYDGSDPSALRFQNLTSNGFEVHIQEDITFDEETTHTTEVINYLALDGDNGLQGTAYDSLTGNRAIVGTDSNDYLLGLAENDTLIGKGGRDIFVLQSNQGTDTIADFELGIDQIGLADGLTYGSLSLADVGSDTSVMFNNNEIGIIKGVQSTDLNSNDFVAVSV